MKKEGLHFLELSFWKIIFESIFIQFHNVQSLQLSSEVHKIIIVYAKWPKPLGRITIILMYINSVSGASQEIKI